MTNATGTTRSTYSRDGLTVSIDWQEEHSMTPCLVALVTSERGEYVRTDRLTEKETLYVVRNSADHTEYARTYFGMIY